MMKRWRVGSLSMGIILVVTGIMMLASLVVQVNVLDILLTFWPVILICLGIEILLHLFAKKDADTKIRYDVLSILFIGFLLIISAMFYAITYSIGLLGSGEDMYTVFGIKNEDIHIESAIELTGTKELVVFKGFDSIRIISTTGENIRIEYSIAANTNDMEYAESMLGKSIEFETGERAYMFSKTTVFYNNRRLSYPIINCVIYLPPGKTLDLSQLDRWFEYDSLLESQIILPQ